MPDRPRQTDVLLHYLDQQQQLDQLYAHGPISAQPVPRSSAPTPEPGYPASSSFEPPARTDGPPTGYRGRRAARLAGRSEPAQPEFEPDLQPALLQRSPETRLDGPADTSPTPTRASARAQSSTRAPSRGSSRRRLGPVGLLALLVAVVLVVAAGVLVTRWLTSPGEATLKTAGDQVLSDKPATAASSTPATSAPVTGPLSDLGDVKGVYALAGPKSAPAGSWAVLTLSGVGRHIVKTDTSAPFRVEVDTAKLPNGTYTLSVLVVNPGHAATTSSQLLHVKNPATAKSSPKKKKSTSAGSVAGAGSAQATQVVALTNQQRAKAGCKPLTVNGTLTGVAQAHSADMAKKNYFDHNSKDGRTPFQRMSKAGYVYRMAAENIAMGQQTPASVMDAWMNSAGHKANILNCGLKQIGVGYALNAGGTPYWTQDFGTPA